MIKKPWFLGYFFGITSHLRIATARLGSFSGMVRVKIALVGLMFVTLAELLRPGVPEYIAALMGFVLLFAAATIIMFSHPTVHTSIRSRDVNLFRWRWFMVAITVIGILAAQTWFKPGTVIAGGDLTPPIGTAWISRIFESFTWSGTNLGGPNNSQVLLPWAVVKLLISHFGGSGALAQRIWYTLLIAAIFTSVAGLVRSLSFTPLTGVVTSLVYFYNPLTLSEVGTNNVYLTAMLLIAVLPALVISYSRGRLRLWQLCLSFLVATPFMGYVSANPPLVVMVVGVVMLTPALIRVRFDGQLARVSLYGLAVVMAVCVASSSYWIVPYVESLRSADVGTLASLSSWTWQQSRATLTNAFWLNTAWGWTDPSYFPYSRQFVEFPLDAVRVAIPLLAYSPIAVNKLHHSSMDNQKLLKFAAALALLCLSIQVLSTGTRLPGSPLFLLLYKLPYGWLLQEPGRFLLVASLGYALLVGLFVETLSEQLKHRFGAFRNQTWFKLNSSLSLSLAALFSILIFLVSGYPLLTGSVVNTRNGLFPSDSVKVPTYWKSTVAFLNSKAAPTGSLLVLPPDDFYQMPYSWYYGTDGFIANSIQRPVVDPNLQGYFSGSQELHNAVTLEAEAIASEQWTLAGRVLQAVGTRLVLLRRDILSNFPGRQIISPDLLSRELRSDPEMRLIYQNGQLQIFKIRHSFFQTPKNFITMNTLTPDLGILGDISTNEAIIKSPPLAGHTTVLQLPPLDQWSFSSGTFATSIRLPSKFTFSVRSSNEGQTPESKNPLIETIVRQTNGDYQVQASLIHPNEVAFSANSWGPVGNCNDATPLRNGKLAASVIDNAGPSSGNILQLSASADVACVSRQIPWNAGSFIVHLSVRSMKGSPPRMCFWEEPIGRCIVPSLPKSNKWNSVTFEITPDQGTKTIRLFLYSDVAPNGSLSVDQYSKVSFTYSAPPTLPHLFLVGTSNGKSTVTLADVLATGYSNSWYSAGGAHVLVDGMRNGWLVNMVSSTPIYPHYIGDSHLFILEILFSALFLSLAALFLLFEVRRHKPRTMCVQKLGRRKYKEVKGT